MEAIKMEAKRRIPILLLITFLGGIASAQNLNSAPTGCQQMWYDPTSPMFNPPKFTDKTYNAIYEYTNHTKKMTLFSDPSLFVENFDGNDGIYSTKVFEFGVNVTYIEEDSTDQIYIINPDKQNDQMVCKVQNRSDSADLSFMPKLPRLSIHGGHTYFLQQLLTIDPKYLKGYAGEGSNNDRGLKADRYDYCFPKERIGVSIYWSKKEWKTIDKRSPLWIEIRFPNYQISQHVETINIFYFKGNEISKSELVTPAGVYCPGRKSIKNKQFPLDNYKLDKFRFRGENIRPQDKTVSWSNHWYDLSYNVRRIDYPEILQQPVSRMSDILMYNFGYGFQLNRRTGECKVKEIDSMINDGAIFQYIKSSDFSDPKLLFGSKNQSYTYIGKRKIRGIECDVYQTLRKSLPIGFENSTSVCDMYIRHNGEQGYAVPIAMRLTPYNHTSRIFLPGDEFIYYFYDWHYYGMRESDLDAYDVSDCYPDDHKEELMMQIDLKVTTENFKDVVDLINNPRFLFKIRDHTALAAGGNLLQIANVRSYIDNDASQVYVLFTLLGLHPSFNRSLADQIPELKSALISLEDEINHNNLNIEVLFQGLAVGIYQIKKLRSRVWRKTLNNMVTQEYKTRKFSAVPYTLKSVLGYVLPLVPSTTKKPVTVTTTTKPTVKVITPTIPSRWKVTTTRTTTIKPTQPIQPTTTVKVPSTTSTPRWKITTPSWEKATTKTTKNTPIKSTTENPGLHIASTTIGNLPTASADTENPKKLFTPGVDGYFRSSKYPHLVEGARLNPNTSYMGNMSLLVLAEESKPKKQIYNECQTKIFEDHARELGGSAVGSLLGGLVIGAILTFVQVKFMNGKFFGVQVNSENEPVDDSETEQQSNAMYDMICLDTVVAGQMEQPNIYSMNPGFLELVGDGVGIYKIGREMNNEQHITASKRLESAPKHGFPQSTLGFWLVEQTKY
ncbi:hypothetical protein GQR58_006590 [Nymphon striatum]|nr:hypothetical protein GQR58_006590 [Nymphon striatum]